MGRAALAVVLLLAAARSFGAARQDLQLRSRLLLREIRAQAAAPAKDTGRLRAELSALKAENGAAPDEKVSAELKTAETDLALVDAGSPLPPPSPEESLSDDELRDAVAQPAAPARPPVMQDAAPATLPDSASKLFDGSIRRGGLVSPAVEAPPDDPDANLDQYLGITDPKGQMAFLVRTSAGLLEKLHMPDKTGARAEYLGSKLLFAINSHPQRASFIALRVTVRKDKSLHLIYRLRDGGAVDELLGSFVDWSTSSDGRSGGGRSGGGGRKKGGKKSHGHAGDGAGDGAAGDGGGSAHGKGHGGHKGHGGAGGAGGGDDGGGDGGGGTGAGRGGSGAAHHAKAPHGKGGAGMFDGGGDGGDPGADGAAPGDGLFSGNGPRSRGGRKGRRAGGAAGEAANEGTSGGAAGAFGSGRAHAKAGRSISGEGAGASASNSRKRSAFVPLPKDFTTRGGGSRLSADGGDGFGPRSAGLGGFHMSALGKKEFHHDAPLPAAVPSSAMTGAALAQAKPEAASAPAAAPSAPAGGAPGLASPLAPEEDLHDAVAGDSAPPPADAVPGASPASAPPAPPAPVDSGPLAVACACAAAIGLGAYAFRRSRRA